MKTLILAALFFLSSCSFFSSHKSQDRTYSYLTGKGLVNPTTQEIKQALVRESSMAGGNYQISAYPYTHTLIEAMVREAAQQRGLNSEQQKEMKTSLENLYLIDKTCFHFAYEVLRFKLSSRLENWKLFVVDKAEQEYTTTWNAPDLVKAPILSRKIVSGDKLEKWQSSGVACTPATLKLTSGFSVKVAPEFVQFPFPKSVRVYWDFPEIEIVDGQAQEVPTEKKKRNHRSYRGW